ncbi:MAG: glycosyltransferase family 2 protein [Planctomycetota bacterium]|nr:glycosyltransferase family 2 protein [Planctomycetota bacterium]
MTPRVSIVIPTYNHERFLGQCLESVLSQTYGDWEAVVIDDASTDGTARIAESFARRDPRITFLRHAENRGILGLARTYNEGLAATTGEFVVVLEGDDFWPPWRLAAQIPSFATADIVLSHGLFDVIETIRPGREVPRPISYPYRDDVRLNEPVGSALKALLLGSNPLRAQAVMTRRSALAGIGGFQQPEFWCLSDYPTWMCLTMKGRFAFVERKLGTWRRHSQAVTTLHRERMLRGFLKHVDLFIESNGPAMYALLPRLRYFVERRGMATLANLSRICLAQGRWREACGLMAHAFVKGGILGSLNGIYRPREYAAGKLRETVGFVVRYLTFTD